MSERKRILFHLNQLGFGGTEKAILTFCQNLDRTQFDLHLFISQPLSLLRRARIRLFRHFSKKNDEIYRIKLLNARIRLGQFESILGQENIHQGSVRDFVKVCAQLTPDIIHFNRGKWDKFFSAIEQHIPANQCFVETNIFGYPAAPTYHRQISAYYFVSHWLMNKSAWHAGKGKVLLNPIKQPATDQTLREQYAIPREAFVFGRISRPDLNDDDFIVRAFEQVAHSNCYLFILAPTRAIRDSQRPNNIILLEPTIDEVEISRFYNSLNALLHYRREGETFGMNIAEAMMHGVPVISHDSDVDNAQLELLAADEDGPVGLVSPRGDMEHYSRNMATLLNDPELCALMEKNARNRAARLYDEKIVTRTLEGYYRLLVKG